MEEQSILRRLEATLFTLRNWSVYMRVIKIAETKCPLFFVGFVAFVYFPLTDPRPQLLRSSSTDAATEVRL